MYDALSVVVALVEQFHGDVTSLYFTDKYRVNGSGLLRLATRRKDFVDG